MNDKKARLARLAALQREADASASYTNTLSLRLTQGLKARRFAQIFKYLAQARPLPPCSGRRVRNVHHKASIMRT